MEKVQVINGSIALPPMASNWVGQNDELTVFIEGDSLILKRLRPPRLSEIAARAPEDTEMPIDDIVAEIHNYRREKRDTDCR